MILPSHMVEVRASVSDLLDLVGDTDADELLSALLASNDGREALRDEGFYQCDTDPEEDDSEEDNLPDPVEVVLADPALLARLTDRLAALDPAPEIPAGATRSLLAFEHVAGGAGRTVPATASDVAEWLRRRLTPTTSEAQLELLSAFEGATLKEGETLEGSRIDIRVANSPRIVSQRFPVRYRDLTTGTVRERAVRLRGGGVRVLGWCHTETPESGSVEDVSPVEVVSLASLK